MIKDIIDLLSCADWYGVSHNIDIAKGIYKAPKNWSETKDTIKRVSKAKDYING